MEACSAKTNVERSTDSDSLFTVQCSAVLVLKSQRKEALALFDKGIPAHVFIKKLNSHV